MLRLLSGCGIDYVQGFYIAKPIPEHKARGDLIEQTHACNEVESSG